MIGLSSGLLDNYNCTDPANINQSECDGEDTPTWKIMSGVIASLILGGIFFYVCKPVCRAVRTELQPKTDPGLELSFSGAESNATPFLQAANDSEAKGKPLAVVVSEQPNPFDDD